MPDRRQAGSLEEELSRTREALRESKGWLRATQRVARLGHYVYDLAADRWTSSEALDELFGIDAAYPRTAATWLALVHPDERDGMSAHLLGVAQGAHSFDRAYRILRPDGEERWVQGLGEVLPAEEGRPARLFGTIQDVTARRRGEEELQASQRKLALYLAQTLFGVIEFDLALRVRYWNPAASRIFGWSSEEALGRRAGELILPPAAQPGVEGVWRALAAGGGSFRNVNENVTRDGRAITCEWFNTPLVEPDGRVSGVMSLCVDVTERRQAEAARRRLEAAVEQTPAAVVVTDTEGRIEYVNPAFERITGWPRQEALGQTPRLLKSGHQDAAFYRELWETISAGRVWHGRLVNRARSGAVFTEDAVIAPVRDEAGVVRSYVAVKRDVTRELVLQESLARSQKLESIGRLAGGVAHDFNNLLTAILSCAESLRDELVAGRPAGREEVEEIQAAGERARDLTRQLLAFARRQVIAPVPLDLNAVVRDGERLLRRVLGADVALEVALQPGLWPVRCDPGQLEQVLLNLAVNARDAMPGGGRLELATSHLAVEVGAAGPVAGLELPPGDYVRLLVRDDGVGMGAEVKARLFEPFFTTKPVGQGTGLGLATAYGIVTQSGGHIAVESEPGRGATFQVIFPRAEAPVAAERRPAAASPGAGSETVLLVEDDRAVLGVAGRALRGAGYRVLEAESPAQALQVAAREQGFIHLLLSDVVLPGLSGRQLALELTRRRPGLRVLLVSGRVGDDGDRSGPAGAGFLAKPFTPSRLLEAVRATLDAEAAPAGAGTSVTARPAPPAGSPR